jgi:hypothetical protein
MKKLHIVGIVFGAMLALSAISASAAFAESEWLFNGAAITTALPVESSGEILLEDMGTGTQILCSGIFVGTVTGKTDEITDVVNLSLVLEETTNLAGTKVSAVSCTIEALGLCLGTVGELVFLIPINLPWKTEILLEGTVFVDDILPHAGGGNPGYEVSCNTLIGVQTDVCTGTPGVDLENGVSDVLAEFLAEDEELNPPGNCSVGGSKQALIGSENGPGLIEHTGGGTLSVS